MGKHLCIFRDKDLPEEAAEWWFICYCCRRLQQDCCSVLNISARSITAKHIAVAQALGAGPKMQAELKVASQEVLELGAKCPDVRGAVKQLAELRWRRLGTPTSTAGCRAGSCRLCHR